MAHIAACMAGNRSSISLQTIARSESPMPSNSGSPTPSHPFRMQQGQEQPKRYQFFPRETQLPVLNSNKALDPEKAYAFAMAQKVNRSERSAGSPGQRSGASSSMSMRRRKPSMPDIEPSPNFVDKAMDSPTIPGRPPLHERSNSAPGGDGKESIERKSRVYHQPETDDSAASRTKPIEKKRSVSNRRGASPKRLAPIVIPQFVSKPRRLLSKRSFSHLRSGSVSEESLRSNQLSQHSNGRSPPTPPTASVTDLTSPYSAATPHSAAIPHSARLNPLLTKPLPTPMSAPASQSQWASSRPWAEVSTPAPVAEEPIPQPTSEPPAVPSKSHPTSSPHHRRGASESIMDRGRPRKRTSSRNKVGSEPRQSVAVPEETITQTTFDKLPSGSRPEDAAANMTASQIVSLQRQALRQAMQFEVLSAEDVEALSKELHRLDERTRYLRNNYNSIRAGRRNLQERICQFHRIARVAKYSCDTMLKQEEALADLDACIDEWVNKLERAEDRRTRIRQKLLEHVAAAAIMSIPEMPKTTATEGSEDSSEPAVENHTPTLHGIFTPPRSPSRNASPASSVSPPRLAAHVPSTILEQPVVEAEEEESFNEAQLQASSASVVSTSSKREEVQSIRVYAGDDIYTLLADVESEMTKMRHSVNEAIREALPETEPTPDMERDRSAELLCGLEELTIPDLVGRRRSLSSPLPNSPPAPPPPIKDFPMKKRYSRDLSSML
ncbi:unnamed protein product [Clonostachys rosea]|uniref:Up-regulated during septation protein 1 domain-containing protein n=1 Tax=Bionectria ochroleuca TaxID=29856 RepID=A0ABY6TW16_BIOOC|nr:unnamed protein product [Clonostachys rosea]